MEYKTKQMTSAMLIFSGLVIVIFSFAFELTFGVLEHVLPGMIWVALVFSSILGLNRSFLLEKSNDCMQGLLLLPSDRTFIFLGKFTGNFLFVLLTQMIIVPGFFIFFDYPFQGSIPLLIFVLLIGMVGFIAVGTFLAALASNSRMSDMLLPIILFPISVPLIIAGVESTSLIFQGASFAEISQWVYLILVFDIVFLVVPYMLFDYVMEV
ncbi:transcriptional regulator [Desulfuribacillus alkaliarsenatis]|uniref:Heme exporter protein B n=2 Tax=Desulfuribacillus alkaliarsenatis TaxID=766136 RepID=A0A1E5G049_9FIRM|nr:transcriptional regulator [Desulfuribacillus alkaliarsenatis]